MKRTSFFYFSLAAIAAGSLASCQDYDAGFSEDEIFSGTYASAFVEAFGEIDPNQNWGFDPMPIVGVDYGTGTRGSNTNSNQWESEFHYKVPGGLEDNDSYPWGWSAGDVTNYERAYVYWWFSTHQWPTTQSVNWSNFFIENVWGQPEHANLYADGSSWEKTQFGLDDMHILVMGNTPTNSPAVNAITNVASAKTHVLNIGSAAYEQINNYNAGGTGSKEQVMYVFDTSTADFTYKLSFENEVHNNWTIQYINGNYYLAFDYWHQKPENNDWRVVDPDGYYNDWILKLSSGTHVNNYYTRRIMCEDLGNTLDWDFNDVVFDVTPYMNNSGGYYAVITLQAAGGTMPIYIGDLQHEAHALFGVNTSIPVNVDAPTGVKRPAVVFQIPLTSDMLTTEADGKTYCRAEKIPIYVPSRDNIEGVVDHPNGGAIKVVALEAPTGKAPQKFACESVTYWPIECTHIELGHTQFWTWVKDGAETPNSAFITSDNTPVLSVDQRKVLYADLGKPSASTYYPGSVDGHDGPIVPWRTLWTNMVNSGGLTNPAFVADRKVYKNPDDLSSEYMNNTFYSQAPYIYETVGADDDPVAYASIHMTKVNAKEDHYGINQEIVWQPTINFTINVVANPSEGGTVTGGGSYAKNSTQTITATPNQKYRFVKWQEDNSTEASRTITVTDNKTYTAIFERTFEEFKNLKKTISSEQILQNGTSLFDDDTFVDVLDDTEYLVEVEGNNGGFINFDGINQGSINSGVTYKFLVKRGVRYITYCQNITSIKIYSE